MRRISALIGLISLIGLIRLTGLIIAPTNAEAVYRDEDGEGLEFVPGEIIVSYTAEGSPTELEEKVNARARRAQRVFGAIENRMEDIRIRMRGDVPPEEVLTRMQKIEKELDVVWKKKLFNNFYLVKSQRNIRLGFFLARYGLLSNVASVEPNSMVYIQTTPEDTYYSNMWDLKKISMEEAWNQTQGSSSVKVAVIDTGIYYNHEDFQGRNIVNGRDFSTCAACNDLGRCVERKSRDNDSIDDHGHGTHVAGIIGAVTNNSKGVAGINWDVTLMAVKAMGRTGCGDTSDILEAIKYAADQGANVINMSLGGPGGCSSSSSYQFAINYAVGKGTTVVVAAGNDSVNAANLTPASCRNVITVGATGLSDERADYSNYGSVVDVAAPGGNPPGRSSNCSLTPPLDCILSTWLPTRACFPGQFNADNTYCPIAGTSMASPHVAGVAALLLAKDSSLSPARVEQILKDTGDVINTDRPIGKRINANSALAAITGGGPTATPQPTEGQIPTPTPTTTPTPGGPTATPSPTIVPTIEPTAGPTGEPSATPIPINCPVDGDYNGDGRPDILDYEAWEDDYSAGPSTGSEADLACFEYWRRATFEFGSVTPTITVAPTAGENVFGNA